MISSISNCIFTIVISYFYYLYYYIYWLFAVIDFINVMILVFYILLNSTFDKLMSSVFLYFIINHLYIIGLSLSSFIYFIILITFSTIFSISLYNTISSSTSDNFECGFYSLINSSMKYRFNYWMVIFHFLIFELELLMSLFLIFGLVSFNSNAMVCILLSLLFMELFILFH